ncbi:hypothetical protein ACVWQR_05105 [Neisseria meningitidis]
MSFFEPSPYFVVFFLVGKNVFSICENRFFFGEIAEKMGNETFSGKLLVKPGETAKRPGVDNTEQNGVVCVKRMMIIRVIGKINDFCGQESPIPFCAGFI